MDKKRKKVLLIIFAIFAPGIVFAIFIATYLLEKSEEWQTRNNKQDCLKGNERCEENAKKHFDEENYTNEEFCNIEVEAEKKEKFTFKEMFCHLPKNILNNMILIIVGLVLVMIIGITLILCVPNSIGKTILMASAFVEIIVAIIGLLYLFRKEKYTCPECGAKREHHRQFIETTCRQLIQRERDTSLTKRTMIYKHIYLGTYVCPECGETMENQETSEGGKIVYDYRGVIVFDSTKPPKEF